jgi:hypothetical protein
MVRIDRGRLATRAARPLRHSPSRDRTAISRRCRRTYRRRSQRSGSGSAAHLRAALHRPQGRVEAPADSLPTHKMPAALTWLGSAVRCRLGGCTRGASSLRLTTWSPACRTLFLPPFPRAGSVLLSEAKDALHVGRRHSNEPALRRCVPAGVASGPSSLAALRPHDPSSGREAW